jgi:hypothetical protein
MHLFRLLVLALIPQQQSQVIHAHQCGWMLVAQHCLTQYVHRREFDLRRVGYLVHKRSSVAAEQSVLYRNLLLSEMDELRYRKHLDCCSAWFPMLMHGAEGGKGISYDKATHGKVSEVFL